jgi:hypothetical protein
MRLHLHVLTVSGIAGRLAGLRAWRSREIIFRRKSRLGREMPQGHSRGRILAERLAWPVHTYLMRGAEAAETLLSVLKSGYETAFYRLREMPASRARI